MPLDDASAAQVMNWMHPASGLVPYGLRYDSPTAKGMGYFGRIPAAGGNFASELSSANEQGDYPLLVPTLTRGEIDHLAAGGKPTEQIYKKAEEHAAQRRAAGLSPFAGPNDLRVPLPEKQMPLVPVNQNGFPLRLAQAMPQQKDPAQPEFMQRFLQLLMQLRQMPPQQQQAGIPGVSGAPMQAPGPSVMPPQIIGGRG